MSRDLAIVGMVCKTPGAESIEQFWKMVCEGTEGLRELTEDERNASQLKGAGHVVYAGGFIDGVSQFDPEFFGFTSRDAVFMDPQHRLFLQACWEALEISGNAGDKQRSVGVFASASHPAYLTHVLLKEELETLPAQALLLGNASDCLATRVSYSLNLTGPSMTIQCGCSSSLVAVHQARLALLAKQCDVALVGGVSLAIPQQEGYLHVEGGFASPDGHCRPFSNDAAGTVFSSGYGVIVLKRMDDAITDGDCIYAAIKGSAINNDGADKASFTSPSVQGQANVIAKALRVSETTPDSVQYIEAHGTGTPIGDPVEITALKQIFVSNNAVMLGSVKANIGHLDVAAGIIGLIKTSLMLHYKTMPPQIHFNEWNAHIDAIGAHPFQINTEQEAWVVKQGGMRRAGVSGFGFGGTNAHVVLEERTLYESGIPECSSVGTLIVLSAKTVQRLLDWAHCLETFLENVSSLSLASLAYTLQVGRRQWSFRCCFHAISIEDVIDKLKHLSTNNVVACQSSLELGDLDASNLSLIEKHWLDGAIIDWQKLYQQKMTKCQLPAAPLQTASYWYASPSSPVKTIHAIEKRHDQYDQWLYRDSWREQLVAQVTIDPSASILIVGPLLDVSLQRFVQYCKSMDVRYCLLEPSTQYARIDNSHYQYDIKDASGFTRLESQWERDGFKPRFMVQWLQSLESLTMLPQMIDQLLQPIKQSTFIRSITTWMFVVSGMSDLFWRNHDAHLAILIAFSRGIRQELPHLLTKLIDIDPCASTHQQQQQIVSTLGNKALQDYVVWRDNRCWHKNYQNASTSIDEVSPHYFKKNGIYLITGGLGNVASVHVDYLASDHQATLVLVGKTAIPSEELWPQLITDPDTACGLKKKLQQLQVFQQRGYTIVPYAADVTSITEFRTVCQSVHSNVGQIDGIVHIAGVGSDMHYKVLNELTAEHCWQLIQPKLCGVQVVNSMMQEFNIPDCLVISSISSVLAGIGLAAYAGVHNLLDAYVKKHHPTWRLMNWDAWNFHLQATVDSEYGALGAGMDKLAITPAEGLEVLRAAFRRSDWQQVYISTVDLDSRMKQWVNRDEAPKPKQSTKRFARPALRSEYVKSSTVLEHQLIELWESLIGIEPIGIQDNFFELGGDSLLALELISQIKTTFEYACSVMDLFAAATIEKLAEKIKPDGTTSQNTRLTMARNRAAKARSALICTSDITACKKPHAVMSE